MDVEEGYGWPPGSRTAHYFVNGISLCGVWMYAGDLEQGDDGGQDFCPECRKRLRERRERKT